MDELRAEIERFLADSRQPVLLEPGESPFALQDGSYAVERRAGWLTFQVWDETRNLARRVTGVRGARPGRLDLVVERFGKRPGTVSLFDLARVNPQEVERRGARLAFREQFRRFLSRQFPGARIAEISSELNLEASLSSVYPRALVKQGVVAWAAVAAPPGADAAASLTYGLIWLDYLRQRERRLLVEGLALFLPQGEEPPVCWRLKYLNLRAARIEVFVYSEDGYEERVDPGDRGNLDTRLEVCKGETTSAAGNGPEAWIEELLRRRIEKIDATLRPAPVYGQVPAFAGGARGVLDLLAVDRGGRLVVLELKATEDIQLPMQALDYWMRVNWHAGRDEFSARGYFPGIALRTEAPRLLLAAPALQFHPKTEVILRYFAPEIEVERIGLGLEPPEGFRVLFRLAGARRPD